MIYNRLINENVYMIAEMSANHGGDLERAKEIIYQAKKSGADCIKIQTYTADTMTVDSNKKYFRINGGLWDGYNLYELYKQAYTPWEWTEELHSIAKRVGLDFLSTPFDNTAVDFLESQGLEFYKIASFELTELNLISYVASKKKPIIMSTGMASIMEIQEALDTIKTYHNQVILLKCTSAYPANASDVNISTMVDMRERFGIHVGLSDHSLSHLPAVVAASNGAKVIEKHFCLDRKQKTADSEFSLTPDEYKDMVEKVREVKSVLGQVGYGNNDADKVNKCFRRSIFWTKSLKKGEVISPDDIKIIRPSNGLSPKEYGNIVGKVVKRDTEKFEPVSWEDIIND